MRPSKGSIALLLVGAIAVIAPAAASARVPRGFVGMNVDQGLWLSPQFDQAEQMQRMAAAGVQSLRMVFSWADAQPYASWSDVPPGQAPAFQPGPDNVPTTFAQTDTIVALAAEHGMTVLPTVLYTPAWAAAPRPFQDLGIPRDDATYARYVSALVARYGPRGSFWSEHPSLRPLPIRAWQIWNEPNTITRWPIQPFAKSYVALVRAARAAIKAADPGATVVLAGLPNYSWKDLRKIYRVPGARRLFDAVCIHPYTATPGGVITILQLARDVMAQYGDAHKPMIATEIGWPSSFGNSPEHYPFDTTPAGQAKKLAAVLPLLARRRKALGLSGFDVYTWIGTDSGHSFNYAGLFRLRDGRVVAKPAFAAFRTAARALER